MSTVTLEDARRDLDALFERVLHGEVVVIEEAGARVALLSVGSDLNLAPAGYFAQDYSPKEIAELNQLASQGPARIVP